MNNSLIFKNENLGEVRVIFIDNEPLFMASDLCQVLEYKNGKDTINRLFEDGVVKCYPIVEIRLGIYKAKNRDNQGENNVK